METRNLKTTKMKKKVCKHKWQTLTVNYCCKPLERITKELEECVICGIKRETIKTEDLFGGIEVKQTLIK